MKTFPENQRVSIPFPLRVCGERVKGGTGGVVIAEVDVLGTPIFRVLLDDGRILPMRRGEIEAVEEEQPCL